MFTKYRYQANVCSLHPLNTFCKSFYCICFTTGCLKSSMKIHDHTVLRSPHASVCCTCPTISFFRFGIPLVWCVCGRVHIVDLFLLKDGTSFLQGHYFVWQLLLVTFCPNAQLQYTGKVVFVRCTAWRRTEGKHLQRF